MARASTNRTSRARSKDEAVARPVLQWVAAGCGLAITLGAAGVILTEALQPTRPAELSVRVEDERRTPTHRILDVVVSNAGSETAAAVEIAGEAGGRTASATLDYVPGGGEATAALAFPAAVAGEPDIRVIGWSDP